MPLIQAPHVAAGKSGVRNHLALPVNGAEGIRMLEYEEYGII
jgi:hypothetical protein